MFEVEYRLIALSLTCQRIRSMPRSHFGIFFRIAVLIMLCQLLAGCDQQEQTTSSVLQSDKMPRLTVGLLPEQDVFAQKKRYQPLLDYLSARLGLVIESKVLPRYMNIIDNFNELELDGAFFGSFTGALAIEKLQVEPLARPQYVNGASTYYGMVFVKKGSGIRTADDMRGKRVAFVDKATTAGYLLPLSYFQSIGITDAKAWFDAVYFSGTHEDAIYDVLNGHADIGSAKNTVFYRMAAADNRISRELDILATSPHVPANGLAVRGNLPAPLKQALRKQFLHMHEDPQGREILTAMGIDRFIDTTVKDYQPVFNYAAGIGLDLKTYNYRNN